jgi:hypothetical protein
MCSPRSIRPSPVSGPGCGWFNVCRSAYFSGTPHMASVWKRWPSYAISVGRQCPTEIIPLPGRGRPLWSPLKWEAVVRFPLLVCPRCARGGYPAVWDNPQMQDAVRDTKNRVARFPSGAFAMEAASRRETFRLCYVLTRGSLVFGTTLIVTAEPILGALVKIHAVFATR